jgi:hypothetical protein
MRRARAVHSALGRHALLETLIELYAQAARREQAQVVETGTGGALVLDLRVPSQDEVVVLRLQLPAIAAESFLQVVRVSEQLQVKIH